MRFTFNACVQCSSKEVFSEFERVARGWNLTIRKKEGEVLFDAASMFAYVNFEAFQLVDDGRLVCSSQSDGTTAVRYEARALRVWLFLPFWAVLAIATGTMLVGVLGMVLSLTLVYLQQRHVFKQLIRALNKET